MGRRRLQEFEQRAGAADPLDRGAAHTTVFRGSSAMKKPQTFESVVTPFVRAPRNTPRLLSAVVPVHNEAAGIAEFLESLAAMLTQIAPNFEIIVVNDGSRDASAAEIARVAGDCHVCY